MRPIYHIVSSLALATLIYFLGYGLTPALIAFLAGVFIDLDHLIDFWALKPKNPFDVRLFLNSEELDNQKKYFLLFGHGWEWLFLVFLLTYFFHWDINLLCLGFGLALHFLLDIANLKKGPNKYNPLTYLFFFRLIKGFKKQNLYL